jgi:Glycosyl transferase family 2
MKLVMTLKVRDEEDVLGSNLRYHLAQGIDFFIVTDNGSVDRTPEILSAYQRAGLMHLLDDDSPDYFAMHGEWVSRMARLAATDFGADWVIHTDADEFWWPVNGTLRDVFTAVREPYGVLFAPRPEFIPRPDGPGPFHQRLVVREARSRLRPKMAHRAAPDVVVSGGGHHVGGASDQAGVRPPGRLATDPYSGPAPSLRFVPCPWWPVRILHFPHRSSAHFLRRMEQYAIDDSFPDSASVRELRRQRAEGRLMERWEALVPDQEEVEAGLRDGRFVEDHSLRDFMRGCPDPLADGGVDAARRYAVEVAAGIPEEHRRRELATLELEMMEASARTNAARQRQRTRHRARAASSARRLARTRERLEQVKRENRRLKRRLSAARSSPWRRLAGAVAQPLSRALHRDGEGR